MTPAEFASWAAELARDAGFADARFCHLGPIDRRDHLDAWFNAGHHGDMAWLAEHRELRLDPRRLIERDGRPTARSALILIDLYTTRDRAADAPLPPGHGRIARYARGLDYHELIKRRLHRLADCFRAAMPTEHFRAFVDTAPVLERELAARAGLGWQGKHTLLIHPRWGSYFFIAGIATTLDIDDTRSPVTDRCGTCTRCIDACPTHAIEPYTVNASRCISYLTIEHKSDHASDLRAGIGDWLFGCDICQQVCPYNAPRDADWARAHSPPATPEYQSPRVSMAVGEVMAWTEDDRRRELKGTAMKRAKLSQWYRNAATVASNLDAGTTPPSTRV